MIRIEYYSTAPPSFSVLQTHDISYVYTHIVVNTKDDTILLSHRMGVSIHWTGLLDWNTGLDYWNDL